MIFVSAFEILTCITQLFENGYVITRRLLGFGSYGRVHMGYRANDGKQLACKVIDLTSIRKMMAEAPPEKKASRASDDKKQLVAARKPSPAAGNIDVKVKAMIKTYEREAEILAELQHVSLVLGIKSHLTMLTVCLAEHHQPRESDSL